MAVLCGKCSQRHHPIYHPSAKAVRKCFAGDNTVEVIVLQPLGPPVTEPAPQFDCEGCNGSGKFYSGGAVVNGVYTGKIGTCYRCNGKGHQSAADRKRNLNYDRYFRKVYA